MTENEVAAQIVDAAYRIHTSLGPGLLESAYEACLYHELVTRGLHVERQKALPLVYAGVSLDCAYRMDLPLGPAEVALASLMLIVVGAASMIRQGAARLRAP